MRLQELLDKRANVWEQMKALMKTAEDEKRELTAEEDTSYTAMDSELDGLTKEIERIQRHDERARQLEQVRHDQPKPETEPEPGTRSESDEEKAYRKAFWKLMRTSMADLDPEEQKLVRRGFSSDPEVRAQGIATGAAGGFLVPEGFRAKIAEVQKFIGSVRSVAEIIETTTGNPLPWPTNNDTGNKGALLAENTQATEQDLTIGQDQLDAYMYTSKIVRVSLQFLQDVGDLAGEDWLSGKLAQRIERILNEHFTTGTGSGQPEGIVTGASSGVTAASATAVTYDELITLIHSVDVAYRNTPNVGWMLHDLSLAAIRKLKDTTNQPLWQPSVQLGVPDTLLGYRLTVNNDMPAMASSNKSILFGDFKAGYVIRDVKEYTLLRLVERYADFLQVGFIGFSRHDGEVQDTSAYKALTQAV